MACTHSVLPASESRDRSIWAVAPSVSCPWMTLCTDVVLNVIHGAHATMEEGQQ
jgi:hypothetical protein